MTVSFLVMILLDDKPSCLNAVINLHIGPIIHRLENKSHQ